MGDVLVGVAKGDGLAVLTLSAPPANTYSYDMMRQLDAAVLDARMDDDVHVIVIRGAGEDAFCASSATGLAVATSIVARKRCR